MELCIQTSVIDADVRQKGSVALDARLLSEIVKKLPNDYIVITTDSNFVTKIQSGKSEFKITGHAPGDFPAMPDIQRSCKLSVEQSSFRDVIRQTVFVAAPVHANPVFTGVLIEARGGVVNVAAVDGFRIAHRHIGTSSCVESVSAIVPGKTMSEIVKLITGADNSSVNIYITDKHILFELDNCTVVSRLINGSFIDYNKAFEVSCSTVCRGNRLELIASLERACLIAVNNGKNTPAVMNIMEDVITITSKTEVGTVRDEIAASTEGNNLTIVFNPRLLLETLKAVDDKEIAIQFGGSLSPCIIRPIEEGNYKYLVLPLRVEK